MEILANIDFRRENGCSVRDEGILDLDRHRTLSKSCVACASIKVCKGREWHISYVSSSEFTEHMVVLEERQ